MFVESHRTLPVPVRAARERLERLLAETGVDACALRAMGTGYTKVGPRRGRGLEKQVRVRVLPLRDVGDTLVLPVRWEPTGFGHRLFPSLDANIGLTGSDELTCLLSMVGSYRPPLQRVGFELDRLVLYRTAQSTADAFLASLADVLCGDSVAALQASPV